MSDETADVEAWTAAGANLVHADRIVGSLSTPELAEWVAGACETLAEMEAAQAVWAASDEAPNCAMVSIGGEEMRVQRGADMPEPLREAMIEVVGAAKRRYAAEKPAEVELDQLKTAVAKFRTYLDRKFRQWCSPHGIASDYATRLIDELDRMTDLDRPADADLCVCGHAHGQHADPDACFALDNGDRCDCDGFKKGAA